MIDDYDLYSFFSEQITISFYTTVPTKMYETNLVFVDVGQHEIAFYIVRRATI
jgi:hypothetical protein